MMLRKLAMVALLAAGCGGQLDGQPGTVSQGQSALPPLQHMSEWLKSPARLWPAGVKGTSQYVVIDGDPRFVGYGFNEAGQIVFRIEGPAKELLTTFNNEMSGETGQPALVKQPCPIGNCVEPPCCGGGPSGVNQEVQESNDSFFHFMLQ
jgi:hypothetical protein